MKRNKEEYPYLCEDRLKYIYKCVNCGAYVKKGTVECYRCNHKFSSSDVDTMVRHYEANYAKNWHHKVYFVLFMLFVLGLLYGLNY